jgi:hypothetical protein
MTKTAWFNNDVLPNEMIRGAKAEIPGWKVLEESEHFKVLDSIIKKINPESICDIGCGSAEVGRIYKNLKYCGVDLPHIIQNVAKKLNPNNFYIEADAEDSFDFSFVEQYDVILMNSFISELTEPLKFLKKLLIYNVNYVIIHRQSLTESNTHLENYTTYGGIQTTNSQINLDDLNLGIIQEYYIENVLDSGVEGRKTIILKNKKCYD